MGWEEVEVVGWEGGGEARWKGRKSNLFSVGLTGSFLELKSSEVRVVLLLHSDSAE